MTEIIKNNNAMAFDLLETGSPEQVNSENGEFFSSIFFGAYRDTVTSLVTKQFKGRSNFIAIKQGIEMPKKFPYVPSLQFPNQRGSDFHIEFHH